MMTYTEEGRALFAAAIAADRKISFSRVEVLANPDRSGGELTLTPEIVSQGIYDKTKVMLKTVMDNRTAERDIYCDTVNVYAQLDGMEVLFAYEQYNTCPIYVPVYDGHVVQNELQITLTVSSAAAVEIVQDGVYVLRTDFEDRMAQKVGFDDIVQNATTRDTEKVASAAVTADLQDQITEQNTNIDKMIKVKKVTVPSFFVEKIQGLSYTMVQLPKQKGETSPQNRLAVKISAYSTQGAVGSVWFTVDPSSGGDWYVYIYNHRNEDANNIYLQFEIYYV